MLRFVKQNISKVYKHLNKQSFSWLLTGPSFFCSQLFLCSVKIIPIIYCITFAEVSSFCYIDIFLWKPYCKLYITIHCWRWRNSHRYSVKKVVLKNFANFTAKHPFAIYYFFIIFSTYSLLELLHFELLTWIITFIIVSTYIMMVSSILHWKWKANCRQFNYIFIWRQSSLCSNRLRIFNFDNDVLSTSSIILNLAWALKLWPGIWKCF